MNAAQAGRLHRLLLDAEYPRRDPKGREYTPDELIDAVVHAPTAALVGYHAPDKDGPALVTITIRLAGGTERARELWLDEKGRAWVWSTVPIPQEECDCECGRKLFADSYPLPRAYCPRHGDGVRELECFRLVLAVGWEIVHDPATVDTSRPFEAGNLPAARWAYVVREGQPFRDVLADYRAERAREQVAS